MELINFTNIYFNRYDNLIYSIGKISKIAFANINVFLNGLMTNYTLFKHNYYRYWNLLCYRNRWLFFSHLVGRVFKWICRWYPFYVGNGKICRSSLYKECTMNQTNRPNNDWNESSLLARWFSPSVEQWNKNGTINNIIIIVAGAIFGISNVALILNADPMMTDFDKKMLQNTFCFVNGISLGLAISSQKRKVILLLLTFLGASLTVHTTYFKALDFGAYHICAKIVHPLSKRIVSYFK